VSYPGRLTGDLRVDNAPDQQQYPRGLEPHSRQTHGRGVEGLSLRASHTPDDAVSAGHALAAVDAWLPGLDRGHDAATLPASLRPALFPYGEVLGHYQRVGRTNADGRLVRRLSRLCDVLRRPELTVGQPLWPLAQWLPSTVDQHTGNYDSYLVTSVLEGLTGVRDVGVDGRSAVEVENATDSTIDMLIAALAADLALIEADALRSHVQRSDVQRSDVQRSDGAGRERCRRTQACLLMLSKLAGLARKWTGRPDPPAPTGEQLDGERLTDATTAAALQIRQRLPRQCRQAVTCRCRRRGCTTNRCSCGPCRSSRRCTGRSTGAWCGRAPPCR